LPGELAGLRLRGALLEARTRLPASSAFVRLSGLFSSRAPQQLREARDEVGVRNHEQRRDVAVERLQRADERRGKYIHQHDSARLSPGEPAPYAELQTAVEQFAAREASLARLERGY
jgi:hypothetical protein